MNMKRHAQAATDETKTAKPDVVRPKQGGLRTTTHIRAGKNCCLEAEYYKGLADYYNNMDRDDV
ncbi:MAG: hypothetical protein DRR08_07420 [Candidatus Parabeggiatoa sp. nov. 2]|nr:MAG: hypothetical protein B6247_07135 [Beggiatoa sp. 4572_84]RKZ61918.1 MAG: hypothetical protein DRR08_07420 [Gammaproteobacteria bacterium]HEC83807.1 hypothetical protein [Thioploca sp.]